MGANRTFQHRNVLVACSDPDVSVPLCRTLSQLGHRVVGPFTSNVDAMDGLAEGSPSIAILEVVLTDGPATSIARALQGEGVPLAFFGEYNLLDNSISAEVPGRGGLYRKLSLVELLAAFEEPESLQPRSVEVA